jgi:hypothetical protein
MPRIKELWQAKYYSIFLYVQTVTFIGVVLWFFSNEILQQQAYIQARYAGALIAALNNQVSNTESPLKVSS